MLMLPLTTLPLTMLHPLALQAMLPETLPPASRRNLELGKMP